MSNISVNQDNFTDEVMSAKNFRTQTMASKVASKLTKDGMDWLTAALDPFHDDPLMVRGLPDGSQRNTILQRVEKTVTISAPAGVAGNWDAHIFNLPLLSSATASGNLSIATDGTYNFCAENAATATNIPVGPVVIASGPAGTQFLPTSTGAFNPPNTTYSVVNPTVSSVNFPTERFVAGGFEVTNTTAEIYRQGTCTSYKQPVEFSRGRMQFQVGAGAIRYNDSTVVAPTPPASVDECLYLPGSCQWPAAEGGYTVITFDPEKEVLSQPTGGPVHFRRDTAAPNNFGFGVWETADPTAAQDFITVKPSHQNIHGQYYTGLSNQTTLQLNVVYYVEAAPAASDSVYAILAKPCPIYDPYSLRLYSAAVANMPVCYPVAMNARGDVWRKIVGTLASIADFLPGADNPDTLMGKAAVKLRESHLTIAEDQLVRAKNFIEPKKRKNESEADYKKRFDKMLRDQNSRIARAESYVNQINKKLALAASAGSNGVKAHKV